MMARADRNTPSHPSSRRGPALLALVMLVVISLLGLMLLLFSHTEVALAGRGETKIIKQQGSDLIVGKKVNTVSPSVGDTITYTVEVTNTNTITTVTSIVISDTLPVGLTLGGANATIGAYTGNTWNVGDLPATEAASLTITATVNAGTEGQSIVNSAQLTQSTPVDSNPINNRASASLTVVEPGAADLVVSKSDQLTGSVAPGATIDYRITIENSGAIPASNIVITDTLGSNLTYTSFITNTITTNPPGTNLRLDTRSTATVKVFQMIGNLGPNETYQFILRAQVSNTATGNLTNTVDVSTTSQEANTTNNSAIETTTVGTQNVDLSLEKSVNVQQPHELEEVVYEIVLTNEGTGTVTSFVVNDILNPQLSFVDYDASIGTYSSTTGDWAASSIQLTAGDTATLTITSTVRLYAEGAAINPIANTANITTSTPTDSNTSNNTSNSVTITPERTFGVTVTVIDAATVSFPVIGATVVLTDTNGTVLSGITGNDGKYTFSSTSTNELDPGVATVKASKGRLYVPNSDVITLQDNQIVTLNIELDTTNLTVSKSDQLSAQVAPGGIIDYRIAIQNSGTITATNIVITDTLGSNLSYSTFITNTITGNPAGTNLRLDANRSTTTVKVYEMRGGLGRYQTYQFILRAQVSNTATGNVTNTVRASTASPEATTTNNTIIETTSVGTSGTANVTVTKTASPIEPRPGQNITFRIDVRNNTNGSVTISSIFDSVPADFENIAASIGPVSVVDVNPSVNNATRNVTVPSFVLDAGDTATLVILARTLSSINATKTGSNSVTVQVLNSTARTASASYRIVAQGTLPSTGFEPLNSHPYPALSLGDTRLYASPHPRFVANEMSLQDAAVDPDRQRRAAGLALVFALLLGGIGALALLYGLRGRGRGSDWAVYSTRLGLAFLGLALVFGLASWGLGAYRGPLPAVEGAPPATTDEGLPVALATVEVWLPPSVPENDLPRLPDFPIPTPQVTATPGQPAPDSSPVTRISIPSIGVYNDVKYVPFDGYSWLISGLRHEVAWLGETSWPGLGGNTALAGHVNLRGSVDGPFRYLDQLIPGDIVRLYTDFNIYTYKVRDKHVVAETEFSVIEKTQTSQLTLITCTGWDESVNLYVQRWVVTADLFDVSSRNGQTNSQ